MVLKIVDNIFFAETDCANQVGHDFPQAIGSIYHFPENYSILGQRLALMLKEENVRIAEAHNLCITFSTYLPEERVELFSRVEGKDVAYCNVGVDATVFNTLSNKDKTNYILKQCERILTEAVGEETTQKKVHNIIEKFAQKGEQIEILHQEKADHHICARLSFQLYDLGSCQPYLALYTPSGEEICKHTLPKAHCYSAAKQQYGTLLIRKDKIIIKPENNIRSKNLKPLEIKL